MSEQKAKVPHSASPLTAKKISKDALLEVWLRHLASDSLSVYNPSNAGRTPIKHFGHLRGKHSSGQQIRRSRPRSRTVEKQTPIQASPNIAAAKPPSPTSPTRKIVRANSESQDFGQNNDMQIPLDFAVPMVAVPRRKRRKHRVPSAARKLDLNEEKEDRVWRVDDLPYYYNEGSSIDLTRTLRHKLCPGPVPPQASTHPSPLNLTAFNVLCDFDCPKSAGLSLAQPHYSGHGLEPHVATSLSSYTRMLREHRLFDRANVLEMLVQAFCRCKSIRLFVPGKQKETKTYALTEHHSILALLLALSANEDSPGNPLGRLSQQLLRKRELELLAEGTKDAVHSGVRTKTSVDVGSILPTDALVEYDDSRFVGARAGRDRLTAFNPHVFERLPNSFSLADTIGLTHEREPDRDGSSILRRDEALRRACDEFLSLKAETRKTPKHSFFHEIFDERLDPATLSAPPDARTDAWEERHETQSSGERNVFAHLLHETPDVPSTEPPIKLKLFGRTQSKKLSGLSDMLALPDLPTLPPTLFDLDGAKDTRKPRRTIKPPTPDRTAEHEALSRAWADDMSERLHKDELLTMTDSYNSSRVTRSWVEAQYENFEKEWRQFRDAPYIDEEPPEAQSVWLKLAIDLQGDGAERSTDSAGGDSSSELSDDVLPLEEPADRACVIGYPRMPLRKSFRTEEPQWEEENELGDQSTGLFSSQSTRVFDATLRKHFSYQYSTSDLPLPARRHLHERLQQPSAHLTALDFVISQHELVDDCLSVLQGVPSNTFELRERDHGFVEFVSMACRLADSGVQSLVSLLEHFAYHGSLYRNLEFFSVYFSENAQHGGGLVRQAFAQAVADYLRLYRSQVMEVHTMARRRRHLTTLQSHQTTLLEILLHTRPIVTQIRWLAQLCHCQEVVAAPDNAPEVPEAVFQSPARRELNAQYLSPNRRSLRLAEAHTPVPETPQSQNFLHPLLPQTAMHERGRSFFPGPDVSPTPGAAGRAEPQATNPFPSFPMGAQLLSYLYACGQSIGDDASSVIAPLLRLLFKKACAPYLRMLDLWMYQGVLDDPCEEFLVQTVVVDDGLSPGEQPLKQFAVRPRGFCPVFLLPIIRKIFITGQSLYILRHCALEYYRCCSAFLREGASEQSQAPALLNESDCSASDAEDAVADERADDAPNTSVSDVGADGVDDLSWLASLPTVTSAPSQMCFTTSDVACLRMSRASLLQQQEVLFQRVQERVLQVQERQAARERRARQEARDTLIRALDHTEEVYTDEEKLTLDPDKAVLFDVDRAFDEMQTLRRRKQEEQRRLLQEQQRQKEEALKKKEEEAARERERVRAYQERLRQEEEAEKARLLEQHEREMKREERKMKLMDWRGRRMDLQKQRLLCLAEITEQYRVEHDQWLLDPVVYEEPRHVRNISLGVDIDLDTPQPSPEIASRPHDEPESGTADLINAPFAEQKNLFAQRPEREVVTALPLSEKQVEAASTDSEPVELHADGIAVDEAEVPEEAGPHVSDTKEQGLWFAGAEPTEDASAEESSAKPAPTTSHVSDTKEQGLWFAGAQAGETPGAEPTEDAFAEESSAEPAPTTSHVSDTNEQGLWFAGARAGETPGAEPTAETDPSSPVSNTSHARPCISDTSNPDGAQRSGFWFAGAQYDNNEDQVGVEDGEDKVPVEVAGAERHADASDGASDHSSDRTDNSGTGSHRGDNITKTSDTTGASQGALWFAGLAVEEEPEVDEAALEALQEASDQEAEEQAAARYKRSSSVPTITPSPSTHSHQGRSMSVQLAPALCEDAAQEYDYNCPSVDPDDELIRDESLLRLGATVGLDVSAERLKEERAARRMSTWHMSDTAVPDQDANRDVDDTLDDTLQDLDMALILSMATEQSLLEPLRAQYDLVSRAYLHLFMRKLHIRDHLHALRRLFLMNAGDLMGDFAERLFNTLEEDPTRVQQPSFLQNAWETAVKYCGYESDPFAQLISVHVDEAALQAATSRDPSLRGVHALNHIRLAYNVQWPLTLVLPAGIIDKYNAIFTFMMKIRRAIYNLHRLWSSFKAQKRVTRRLLTHNAKEQMVDESRRGATVHIITRKEIEQHEARILQLEVTRYEMQHMVDTLQGNIRSSVIDITWAKFQNELQQCATVYELCRTHEKYVDRCRGRCFVTSRNQLQTTINVALKAVHTFTDKVSNLDWARVFHDKAWKEVQSASHEFRACREYVMGLITNQYFKERNQFTEDLRLRLNYNEFLQKRSEEVKVFAEKREQQRARVARKARTLK